MKEEDKKKFAAKMAEMVYSFAHTPSSHMVNSYFNQLASLPLDIVIRAIDEAVRQKREGDLFDQRTVPTVPEIARLARDILDNEKPQQLDSYCDACNHTGWLINKTTGKAHRCKCLQRRIDEQKKGGAYGKGKVYS